MPFLRFRDLVVRLWSTDSHLKLSFSPTQLSVADVASIILILIMRSILHSLGFGSSATFEQPNSTNSEPLVIPRSTLSMPVQILANDIDKYVVAVNSDSISAILDDPSHLLLFLAAITEPAMLLLLAKRSCPIHPLGSVNVRNRMELLDPERCKDFVTSSSSNAMASATLSGPLRHVKRGVEIDLEVQLTVLDPKTGTQLPIFRQIFTILQFSKTKYSPEVSHEKQTVHQKEDLRAEHPPVLFTVDQRAPFRWAAICKDYNPIHTSSLAARLFGFRSQIAHGNHIVAMAVEAIRKDPGRPKDLLSDFGPPIWMETDFKRPMVIPAKLSIAYRKNADTKLHVHPAMIMEISQNSKITVRAEIGFL